MSIATEIMRRTASEHCGPHDPELVCSFRARVNDEGWTECAKWQIRHRIVVGEIILLLQESDATADAPNRIRSSREECRFGGDWKVEETSYFDVTVAAVIGTCFGNIVAPKDIERFRLTTGFSDNPGLPAFRSGRGKRNQFLSKAAISGLRPVVSSDKYSYFTETFAKIQNESSMQLMFMDPNQHKWVLEATWPDEDSLTGLGGWIAEMNCYERRGLTLDPVLELKTSAFGHFYVTPVRVLH